MNKSPNDVTGNTSVAELASSDSIALESDQPPAPRFCELEEKFECFSQKTETALEAIMRRLDHLEANPDDRERQTEKWEPSRRVPAFSSQMKGWRRGSLDKPRDMSIEALLDGGERFVQMSHAHIQEYGDGRLDFPVRGEDIDSPDFLVLDVLPDVLLHAFLGRFTPVASLIRDGGAPHLSLARFEDWQIFAREFQE